MCHDIITLGPVTVQGYGLMIGLGVIAALIMGDYRAKRRGLDSDAIYGMTIFAVVLGFAAAKVLFILTQWEYFVQDPLHFISGAGFVVFGGIIGAIITLYVYCRIKKLDLLTYLDLMVPSVALAQALGRIGCFLAGCCYGTPTELAIGVTFKDSPFAPNGIRLLPTQLFMSLGDFLLMGILLIYCRKERMRGRASALYLLLYSAGRFVLEFFRGDERGTVGALSTSQFIGIFMALAGAAAFWIVLPWLEKRKEGKRG